MDPLFSALTSRKTRLGFHYFPDTLHYRETDLATWLPELQDLDASWLVLQSNSLRAIPEIFLNTLVKAEIEPIVQFHLSLSEMPELNEIQPILEAYANWGVRAVLFFDRPNDRSAWSAPGWTQQDLVERFLDRYLPLAAQSLKLGLNPLFPALEPGGSYWDTAFLRAALQSLDRRKQAQILQNLVLSAHVWTSGRSLNWGAGGPERWPDAKPYHTPAQSEDQHGFRVFDWYQSIAKATLGRDLPIILLNAGIPNDPLKVPAETFSPELQKSTNLAIAQLLAGEAASDPQKPQAALEAIPEQVLACNFWLLADTAASPFQPLAWYQPNGERLAAVQAIKDWQKQPHTTTRQQKSVKADQPGNQNGNHPIRHYLLLPSYEWGVADWHLDTIKPFVTKYAPTVGFSLQEAALASKVTVVGSAQVFPEESLEKLRQSGCAVERINGDGTTIATILAER